MIMNYLSEVDVSEMKWLIHLCWNQT